mgnify:FL=1
MLALLHQPDTVEAEVGALLAAELLLGGIHYMRGLAEAARRSK